MPEQIDNVSVKLKANVYFDGGVVSHTLMFTDGSKKTVGFIRPGQFRFNTDAAERMDIIAGDCRVKLVGETEFKPYRAGSFFNVPAKSGFDIVVDNGLAEYLCSFA
jgi:uncharacterized protein YaiE (UPF0345 family)